MRQDLFELIGSANDHFHLAKGFLNDVYRAGDFVADIKKIYSGVSMVINEQYCLFPDWDEFDPEFHFEGVKLGISCLEKEIILTEQEFKVIVRDACRRYLLLHPEDREYLSEMLAEQA
ncbi:ribonuclease toxin immunity protein CdiI [Leeia aquatica]|uniref:Ribonuclease toxin immunity protein CdiI n=1 Tax=Leeia aquatica TaxID=2725557 RepID=A0A847SHY4_9NEIS|nr:ribonuclease toxin immunity protein CdiI [Leeia aquatica]NLR76976.1 ribonuclease toxin immunity protein CdiI [Leeia aquatica]